MNALRSMPKYHLVDRKGKDMFKHITLIAAAVLAAACGSDDAGSPSPGGAWIGTLTDNAHSIGASPEQIIGLLAENGDGFLVDTSSQALTIYRITGGSGGSQYEGAFTAYYVGNDGNTLPNGLLVDSGTVSGTVVNQGSITGNLVYSGTTFTNPLALAFNNSYVFPQVPAIFLLSSSMQFTSAAGVGFGTVAFKSDLSFTLQNDPCTGAGKLTVIDPLFNAYRLAGTYTCDGADPIDVTGFAYIDRTRGNAPVLEFDDGKATAVLAVPGQAPAS